MIKHFTPHSHSIRESVLQKVLSEDKSVVTVCDEHGLSRSTVYYWLRQQHKKAGNPMSQTKPHDSPSRQWNLSEKLETIKATASMTPEQKAAWCRQHGIYVHTIAEWEKEMITGSIRSSHESVEQKRELVALKRENEMLKKELRRKDRALAETTARLVLKKKLAELLGEDEE